MRKEVIFKALLGLVILASTMVGCSKNDEPNNGETPNPKPGDIHEMSVSVDGKVIEYVKDSLANFGEPESPVIFSVRINHTGSTGGGVGNPIGISNFFRSLSSQDIETLAQLFGESIGEKYSSQELALRATPNVRDLFRQMRLYNRAFNLDLATLLSIAKLRPQKNIFAELQQYTAGSTKSAEEVGNELKGELRDLERRLVGGEQDALLYQADKVETKSVSGVIAVIAKGMSIINTAIKLIAKLIDALTPVVNMKTSYFAFLDPADGNAANYPFAGNQISSPKYTVDHKFWGVTYARASYTIKQNYKAQNTNIANKNVFWIPNLTYKVEDLVCAGGQHVIGEATFYTTPDYGTTIVSSSDNLNGVAMRSVKAAGEIHIDFGDCCSYNYEYYHQFIAYGDSRGYVNISTNEYKD